MPAAFHLTVAQRPSPPEREGARHKVVGKVRALGRAKSIN